MLNRMAMQGRLVRDPELRHTSNDVPVCSFTVAWSEKYKETETKCFLSCTAWRGLGEMVSKYFSKGKEIIVEGKLTTRQYDDRDGNKRTATDLMVESVHFCGPKDGGGGSAPAYTAPPDGQDFVPADYDDGELPF